MPELGVGSLFSLRLGFRPALRGVFSRQRVDIL
jgi:hypothetical protein